VVGIPEARWSWRRAGAANPALECVGTWRHALEPQRCALEPETRAGPGRPAQEQAVPSGSAAVTCGSSTACTAASS
jgi:hypothetical protein